MDAPVSNSSNDVSCNEAEDEKLWNKDIYKVHADVDAQTLEQVVSIKQRLGIKTTGVKVPKPILKFEHLKDSVPDILLRRLKKLGLLEPTPVQCIAIPCILQGKSTIISSETGSGKTFAYLIPVVVQILNLIRVKGAVALKRCVTCLIVVPTAELCFQIYCSVYSLCKGINLRLLCLDSNQDRTLQCQGLLAGCEVAVGTPARLAELVNQRNLLLQHTRVLVLDEADVLFEKSFEKNIYIIRAGLHPQAILVFVMATQDVQVFSKLKSLVRQATTIQVSTVLGDPNDASGLQDGAFNNSSASGGASSAASGINWISLKLDFHIFESTPNTLARRCWLAENIIDLEQKGKVVIFCNLKSTVVNLYNFLSSATETVCMVHGDMDPASRHEALESFRKPNGFQTLVTTDVCSRGINIPLVHCIVNYEAPRHVATFIHRVGRCLRGIKTQGEAYTLLDHKDKVFVAKLVQHLSQARHKIEPSIYKRLEKLAMKYKYFRLAKTKGITMDQALVTCKGLQKLDGTGLGLVGTTQATACMQVETQQFKQVTSNIGREYTIDDEISSSDDE